jgi:peroxiredoxin
MATIENERLATQFGALQAQRERAWTPDQLAANARQRSALRDRFDAAAVAQPGTVLPDLPFADVDGGEIQLGDLVDNGPAVVLVFRFEGCPACNIALPHYAAQLHPALEKRGIPLIAVSPQQHDRLRAIKVRHDLPFPVATDRNNRLSRLLGITFEPDDRPSPPPAGWIGEVTGTGTWELPQPAVLVIGPGLAIQHLRVSPDWLERPEADEILALLS